MLEVIPILATLLGSGIADPVERMTCHAQISTPTMRHPGRPGLVGEHPRHRPEREGNEASELSLGFTAGPIAAYGNSQLNAEILQTTW